MRYPFSLGVIALATLTPHANAWEFRSRFVQRVGNVDIPVTDPGLSIPYDAPTRFRIQFGVFDDAASAAPAGGFVGWNVGNLSVTGTNFPLEAGARRTPGRLSPFTFAIGPYANGNPPAPAGDPFAALAQIDCTLGIQSPIWIGCDADGNPAPQPPPIFRGLNTYISIYEVTVTPTTYYMVFGLQFSGELVAATEWRVPANPFPPDCSDPENPIPGSIQYVPNPTPARTFTTTLNLVSNGVPGPASAALFGIAGVSIARRRRAEAARA